MNVLLKSITDIKPYSRNPRKKLNLDKVVESIRNYGWQQPIVVDRAGVIIAGHSRYEAAKILECKEIPVLIADLSPEKAKAYRIADNKTNQYSEWDYSLLNKEFTDLLDINMDLELTGFDTKELEDFFTFDKEDDVAKIKTEKSCPSCGVKLK
jgi:ParB/RepB/Spo0J family partition protein